MLTKSRYSDQELNEFKNIIEKKLAKASEDLAFVHEQLTELAENREAEGDWMDSNNNNIDMEMLHTMANRQQHHVQDLENALIRIRNKSYGICMVTGELIDRRRLVAVPTTTKSLTAKNAAQLPKQKAVARPKQTKQQPEIITKVIRKKSTIAPTAPISLEDEELLYGESFLDELDLAEATDLTDYQNGDLE